MNNIYTEIINRLEKAHLLRRIYCQRIMSSSKLHFKQIPVLSFIAENEGCTQTDIAEKLQVSAACIATSTKRLQKSGFIIKSVDEDNLRCKRLSLTDKGREVLEECREPFKEYDKMVFNNIDRSELEAIIEIFDKMIYNMEEALGEKHSDASLYEIGKLIRKFEKEKEENISND